MYHAKKKKKDYRGGGMASDMLMKMMQGGMLKMQEMPGGGMMPRKYDAGGMMTDPTRKAERRKALMNELRIAQDPMTNYGSEEARDKDVAAIKARLKDLG